MLKSYFQFTRKERNGIFILLFIIVCIWIAYIFLDNFFKPDLNDYSQFEKQIDEFYASINQQEKEKNNLKDTPLKKDTCRVDINNPNINLLLCIGLKKYLANIWMNYIQKGGRFNKIEDVKKLWGMSDSIYNIIVPYLTLNIDKTIYQPKTLSNVSIKSYSKPEKKIEMVELNTADTTQLLALPNIGSSFASRIIKYRQRLGGFYTKEQLKEIYGFNQELFDKISPYVYVDVFEVKKININTGDYSTLIQNPYFTKQAVKAILQYRKKSGKLNNANDLIIHQIISQDEWAKLKWYVEF